MKIEIGIVFSRLTVIAKSTRSNYFICQCVCGNTKEVRQDHLKNEKTRSCGCLKSEESSKRSPLLHAANTKHGKIKDRVYSTWCSMIQRCNNTHSKFYNRYGGRGISICDRWSDFENFYADMGDPELGMTIDRIDNNGNYEPSNCRWATRKEQQNNRNVCRYITKDGVTNTINQWSRITGIHQNTLSSRINKNLSIEEIFSVKKNRDLSGLALGTKISQAARLAKTHCRAGHEMTPENTRQTDKQRFCRACARDKEARRRAKLKTP